MKFEGEYSKENPYRDNGNVFAVYVNTVASCTEAKDQYSKHDYYVYLSHCHVCGEDSVIDSRESHFRDRYGNVKYCLCMQCGSGGLIKRSENNYYYVTIPGTICPKCGSDDMKYTKRIQAKKAVYHVFQCNDCRHEIELLGWDFDRFYPAGTLYVGENLRGKGFIREGYELYKDNVLFKVYDSRLKRLVDVTSE